MVTIASFLFSEVSAQPALLSRQAALVLTLTAGGATFAGPADQANQIGDYESSLYYQTNPLNAYEQTPTQAQSAAADPRVDSTTQRASLAGVERPQQKQPFYGPIPGSIAQHFPPVRTRIIRSTTQLMRRLKTAGGFSPSAAFIGGDACRPMFSG